MEPDSSEGQEVRQLATLSVDEVQNLLTALNMSKFREAFEENEIDGESLEAVQSVEELETFGIALHVKAVVLYKKIVAFRESGVPVGLLNGSIILPITPKSVSSDANSHATLLGSPHPPRRPHAGVGALPLPIPPPLTATTDAESVVRIIFKVNFCCSFG
jgi:hypothetical protein